MDFVLRKLLLTTYCFQKSLAFISLTMDSIVRLGYVVGMTRPWFDRGNLGWSVTFSLKDIHIEAFFTCEEWRGLPIYKDVVTLSLSP